MAVVDPHYLWALGHAVMLLCASYVLFQTLLFRATPVRIYRLGYSGALLSYAIVVVKSLGRPSLDAAWLKRAFVDENVQYMMLALFWWISKPLSISIVPFATFSLFHCLTFFRTNILPKFVPQPPPAAAGQPRQPPPAMIGLSQKIQQWVKANYDTAMRFVAYTELAIFARIIVGVITFRSSFMSPLFLAHFIRMRYHASPFTRQAINTITARLDGMINPRGGAIASTWATVKRVIAQWAGPGNMQPQAPPAAGANAGAAAGAGANAEARRQR